MRRAIPGPLEAVRDAREDCRSGARRRSAPIVFPSWSPPLVLTRVEQGSQLFGDCLARTEYSRTNRADRAIHDGRKILVAQAFDLAQRDGVAQLFRQFLQGVVDGVRDLPGHQHALWRLDVAQLLAALESLGLLRIELGRCPDSPPQCHQAVLSCVDADPV